MTHQPAISISISFLSPFNRAGGRTFNVLQEMSFADKKTKNLRLRLLNEERSGRIRKLIDRGLIKSPEDVPEHAIPIDLDHSTKATLTIPPPYYEDVEYECVDCGKHSTWLAETQQYYFEVLRGSPYEQAVRCPGCQAARKRAQEKDSQNKQ